MKNTYTVSGVYGSNNKNCRIFVAEGYGNTRWYAVEGSHNINCTCDFIEVNCNVESLQDIDTKNHNVPITSERELSQAISNNNIHSHYETDPEEKHWNNVATHNERFSSHGEDW